MCNVMFNFGNPSTLISSFLSKKSFFAHHSGIPPYKETNYRLSMYYRKNHKCVSDRTKVVWPIFLGNHSCKSPHRALHGNSYGFLSQFTIARKAND